jgi:UDP-N-acetylmuramate dehydrogenase
VENVLLAPLTTYRFGGPARYLLEARGEEDVLRLADALAAEPLPLLVLGRGSNVVIAADGFPGVVLRMGSRMAWWHLDPDGTVTAGAAMSTPQLARRAAAEGRGGLEFYVGFPGSVGGAVRGNAGCHGSDTAEWLISARVVDVDSGDVADRTPAQMDLGYRHSNLRDTDVVVSASYRTVARPADEADERIREITRWRKENQPGGTLNAGSVFKNPPGDAAGRIIDDAGLKGFRVGGVAVSDKHANFFVADQDASPQDLYDLVRAVQERVHQATGVRLEPEVRFVGRFEEPRP